MLRGPGTTPGPPLCGPGGVQCKVFSPEIRHLRDYFFFGAIIMTIWRPSRRGREMSHQELGRQMAARIEADLGEDIVIESRPRLEGRQMVMMIAPKKK